MTSTGPSIRATCRVTSGNSCGSGSVCGRDQTGSFVMTNAHVAGSRVGKVVNVEVESTSERLRGRIVRAAYSSNVSADWALLKIDDWFGVEPVLLSKDPPAPNLSLYTKGFPRCRPMNPGNITQYRTLNNGILLWRPNSVGGQSGSAIWGDDDHLMYALLTWSYTYRGGRYGAGQLTSEIYRQNRAALITGQIHGFAKMPGLSEMNDDEIADSYNDGVGVRNDDCIEGFYSEPLPSGIQDYPIWHDGTTPPPDPDPEPGDGNAAILRSLLVDQYRKQSEFYDDLARKFSDADLTDPPPTNGDDGGGNGGNNDDPIFGL